jgi:hypothetical protein
VGASASPSCSKLYTPESYFEIFGDSFFHFSNYLFLKFFWN